jgi:peptide/nickel transport system substrate-binding protein
MGLIKMSVHAQRTGYTRRSLIAAGFAVLSLAAPCAGQAAQKPFVIDYSLTLPTLDPVVVGDIADNGFLASLYVTLVKFGSTVTPGQPAGVAVTQENQADLEGYLAQSWTTSADGKVLTFKIRDGVKFPSGRPVDALAARDSLVRALKSGKSGTYFVEAAQTGNVQSIDAPDPHTLVITLKRPEPMELQALALPNLGIIDLPLVAQNGGDTWLATHSAGSGPYVLASYQPGVRAVFKANPTFFGPPPREPEVIVNFIPDDATLLLQARNHQADVTLGLSKASTASLQGTPGLKILAVPTARWQLISFPNKSAPFDNEAFREALTYAFPYDAVLKNVAHGFGQLYYGPFPPQFPAFNAQLGAARNTDLAKAKELLTQSGVKLPVNAEIAIREGQNDQEQIATIAQSAWAPLGVNLKIDKLSSSAFEQVVSAPKKDALLVRFDGPSVLDPAWLLDYDLRASSLYNTSNYDNPQAEALLDKAHPLADTAGRQAIWDQIAKLWIADSPRIPVYADVYTAVVSDRVKNWHFAQNGPFDIHLWGE